MTRLYGRSLKGQRTHDHAPHGHWGSTTMISSIRLDGKTACMVLEGATDTEVFMAYLREVLLPTLRPSDIVIMDNLATHKTLAVMDLFEEFSAEVLFLPPYSPDFNPIEKMWSKVKAFLRKEKARSSPELEQAIAGALQAVSESDARNWYLSCGYSII